MAILNHRDGLYYANIKHRPIKAYNYKYKNVHIIKRPRNIGIRNYSRRDK